VTEAPCPLCEPDPVAKTHGSWLGFVKAMDDVSTAFEGSPAGDFLKHLEITPMTKSYKMLTLLAMLNAGKLPGAIAIEDLEAGFARLARRNGTLRAEVGEALENAFELRKLLEKNPPRRLDRRQGNRSRASSPTTAASSAPPSTYRPRSESDSRS
jgi:hypothetical protein